MSEENITAPVEKKELTLAERMCKEYGEGQLGRGVDPLIRFHSDFARAMIVRYMNKGIESIDEKEIMLLQALGAFRTESKISVEGIDGIAEEIYNIAEVLDRKMKRE